MTIQKLAGPARVASIVLLGVGVWGCAPDGLTTEPQLTAVFARPVTARPVTQTPKPAVFNFPSGAYSVTNDGLSPYVNLYTDGVCNVTARTFIDDSDGGTEDANLQMSTPGNKKCSRRVLVTHSGGEVDKVTGMNVNDVGSVTGTQLRSMNFTISNPTKCNRIGFGNLVGGSMVNVTRGADVNGKRTWNVSFSGDGACVTPQGSTILVPVTMNFDVTDK